MIWQSLSRVSPYKECCKTTRLSQKSTGNFGDFIVKYDYLLSNLKKYMF